MSLFGLFKKDKKENPSSQPQAPVAKELKFFGRLNRDVGDVIWAVSEDGHYIKVYGNKGEDRILYRFSDAVNDLKGFKGQKVHLNHWVLNEGIESIEEIGVREYEIILKNGVRIPISESYRKILAEAECN